METPVNCGGNPGQLRRFEYEPTFALPLPLQGGGGAGGGTPSWSPTACPCLTKISKSAQMEDQMRTGGRMDVDLPCRSNTVECLQ